MFRPTRMVRALPFLAIGLSQLALGATSLLATVPTRNGTQRLLSVRELSAKLGGQSGCPNKGARNKACDCDASDCAPVDGSTIDCMQLDAGNVSECYQATETGGYTCTATSQAETCGQYRYGDQVKGECSLSACTKNPSKCGQQVVTTKVDSCSK